MPPVPQRVSVFKRGKTYNVLYYAADGKRHWRSLGVSTKPEALKQLTEFQVRRPAVAAEGGYPSRTAPDA